jgi:hypothetical protein
VTRVKLVAVKFTWNERPGTKSSLLIVAKVMLREPKVMIWKLSPGFGTKSLVADLKW